MANPSVEPTFIVIGAARSGTTTLHHYLLQHPEIYVPRKKRPEPHFFLKTAEYKKGFEYYLSRFFSPATGRSRSPLRNWNVRLGRA